MARSDLETTCTWAVENLEAYVDGDLPPDISAKFQAHLAACPDCAGELECTRDVKAALASLPELQCPDHVSERAMLRIRTEQTVPKVGERRKRLGRWSLGWYIAAAAAIIVVAGGVFVAVYQEDPPTSIATVPHENRPAENHLGRTPLPTPTPEELALAQQQVKATLIYLGNIGQRSAATVTNDLLRTAVHSPLGNAVSGLVEKADALKAGART